ncbi:hypothetical protein [Clostridium paridis]|uniref:Uncharacterized protein n=1 Tax=Clostridium paridis TaxID=2803863 RepID=A0A937K452_9CLOT|nr:hypothetical protein [Clostridium paridis]MBL4931183.1 hypothetical protein [Clostridium paridis]
MKKLIILFFTCLCISFNISTLAPNAAPNSLKEGIYKLSDLPPSKNRVYTCQNISKKESVLVVLFDDHQIAIQGIRLDPSSTKYNLLPMKDDYRLVILGKGEVYIS